MKTARVIITLDCKRRCEGCCNTYPSIMNQAKWINDVKLLADFDEICITGGEPMLNYERTIRFTMQLVNYAPRARIYLYTALYNWHIVRLWGLIAGIQYTLHYPAKRADFSGLQKLQKILQRKKDGGSGYGSNRLYIDPRITKNIKLKPNIWSRISTKPWGDCKIPEHETLFILHD